MHKIYGKESIHPSLGEKNFLNRGTPVVNELLCTTVRVLVQD